jgi:hypothetical protein
MRQAVGDVAALLSFSLLCFFTPAYITYNCNATRRASHRNCAKQDPIACHCHSKQEPLGHGLVERFARFDNRQPK